MTMTRALWASLAAILASPALAADLPSVKPASSATAAAYDWTGFYAGGQIGEIWSSEKYSNYSMANGVWDASGRDFSDLLTGGFQFGYRREFSQNFVLGAEGSMLFNNYKFRWNAASIGNAYYRWADSLEGFEWNAVAIAGYAIGDFLPYVKGGLAWNNEWDTRVQQVWSGDALVGRTAEVTDPGTGLGPTVGAGVAYHVGLRFDVFAEYMHTAFNTFRTNFPLSERYKRWSYATNAVDFGVNCKF